MVLSLVIVKVISNIFVKTPTLEYIEVMVMSIMILLGTLSAIKALRGFPQTSHLIRALIKNLVDFTAFIILMVIVIFGFGLIFAVMQKGVPEGAEN